MKRYLSLLFPLLFLLSACEKEREFVFEIPFVREFDIPPGLNPNLTHFFEFRVDGFQDRLDEQLAQSGLSRQDSLLINPRFARLEAIFPDGNYRFAQRVIVTILDNNNAREREVYFREDVPFNTGRAIDLVGSLSNVTTYLLDNSFILRVAIDPREFTPILIPTRMNFSFVVRRP